MIVALLMVVVMIGLSVCYVMKAIQERSLADQELRAAKSYYGSTAGTHLGLEMLNTIINTYLPASVSSTTAATVFSQMNTYASSSNPDSAGFLVAYARNGGTGAAAIFTKSGSGATAQAVYNSPSVAIDGGTYQYTLRLKPNGNPSITIDGLGNSNWTYPYFYAIQTTATHGNQTRKLSLNGRFTVSVRHDNFARYALFTNSQTTTSGTPVWFISSTNFSGPMFTNGQYNFAYNPSATFTDVVGQQQANAMFYNNGSPIALNASKNGNTDVPVFNKGFLRSQSFVSSATSTQESDMKTLVTGGKSYSSSGIYVPASATNVTLGGIYVKGDATVSLSVDASNRQVYTIVQGSNTRTITVDVAANKTLYKNGSTTTTYTGLPNGSNNTGTVVYVEGNLTSIAGTIQKATQATIASKNDLVVQGNITYSAYTPAVGTPGTNGYQPPSGKDPATGQDAGNLLGLISWQGNARIGTSAPNNVNIHATIMAPAGVFTVDNYDSSSARGTATILGGVISNNYGAFGQFNSSTGVIVSGYGRNFVYDDRMRYSTPPYYPTTNNYQATVTDLNAKKYWQQGGF